MNKLPTWDEVYAKDLLSKELNPIETLILEYTPGVGEIEFKRGLLAALNYVLNIDKTASISATQLKEICTCLTNQQFSNDLLVRRQEHWRFQLVPRVSVNARNATAPIGVSHIHEREFIYDHEIKDWSIKI